MNSSCSRAIKRYTNIQNENKKKMFSAKYNGMHDKWWLKINVRTVHTVRMTTSAYNKHTENIQIKKNALSKQSNKQTINKSANQMNNNNKITNKRT